MRIELRKGIINNFVGRYFIRITQHQEWPWPLRASSHGLRGIISRPDGPAHRQAVLRRNVLFPYLPVSTWARSVKPNGAGMMAILAREISQSCLSYRCLSDPLLPMSLSSLHPTNPRMMARHSFTALNSTFIVDVQYRMLKELGQGAYGCVIAAMHSSTGEGCAIKKITNINTKVSVLHFCIV